MFTKAMINCNKIYLNSINYVHKIKFQFVIIFSQPSIKDFIARDPSFVKCTTDIKILDAMLDPAFKFPLLILYLKNGGFIS